MGPGGPLRAALVGAGLMARWHADAIARVGGIVSVIIDPNYRRARTLAARYAGAYAGADLDEAAHFGAIDVAHLCTPSETHESLTRQALEAGMHVLVEKPMTQTAAAAVALLRLAESRHLLLCAVHQLLFQPGVLRAQDALRSIGPLLHVDAVVCSAGAGGQTDDGLDRAVADILPHPLSVLARVMPEPLGRVGWRLEHPMAGEVRAIGTAGQVGVSVLVSMRGRPTRNTLGLIGEGGAVHLDLFHGFHVVEGGAVSRGRKVVRPLVLSASTLRAAGTNLVSRAARREVAYPGLRELVRRFYRAVERGNRPPISPRELLDVAAARETLIAMM